MARVLNIYCDACNSRAVITRTDRIHQNLSRIYCSCKNPHCGQRWVMILEQSHITQTSKLTTTGMLKHLLEKLSESDKEQIRNLLETR